MEMFHLTIKTINPAKNIFSVFAEDAENEAKGVVFESEQVCELVAQLHEEMEADRPSFDKQEAICKTLGESLFNCFFSGCVLERFKQYRARTKQAGTRIRIGLHLPAELYYLPWEVLRDENSPDHNFFSVQGSVVRYDVEEKISNTLFANSGPARFLFIFPNPVNRPLGTFNLEARQDDVLAIESVSPATWDNFEGRLRKNGVLGILFFGHGEVDNDEGVLLFVKKKDEGMRAYSLVEDPRFGYSVSDVLSNSGMYLACILACESAWTQNKIAFSKSIAGALLRGTELSLVLGAQRLIGSLSTQAFLGKLLDAIAEGDPLDIALSRGRVQIRTMDPSQHGQGTSRLDWWIPVLYTKTLNFDLLPQHDPLFVPEPNPKHKAPPGVTLGSIGAYVRRGFFAALGTQVRGLVSSEHDTMRRVVNPSGVKP